MDDSDDCTSHNVNILNVLLKWQKIIITLFYHNNNLKTLYVTCYVKEKMAEEFLLFPEQVNKK